MQLMINTRAIIPLFALTRAKNFPAPKKNFNAEKLIQRRPTIDTFADGNWRKCHRALGETMRSSCAVAKRVVFDILAQHVNQLLSLVAARVERSRLLCHNWCNNSNLLSVAWRWGTLNHVSLTAGNANQIIFAMLPDRCLMLANKVNNNKGKSKSYLSEDLECSYSWAANIGVDSSTEWAATQLLSALSGRSYISLTAQHQSSFMVNDIWFRGTRKPAIFTIGFDVTHASVMKFYSTKSLNTWIRAGLVRWTSWIFWNCPFVTTRPLILSLLQ